MGSTPLGAARPGRMLARGALRRCPRCGAGGLFTSWFRLRERCPGCGVRFGREDGFWLGGYVVNFASGEAGILVMLVVLIGLLANGVAVSPWPFIVVGVVLATLGPAATFPFSRTIWSAVDLIMRPLSAEEVTQAQAAVAAAALTEPAERPPGRRRSHTPR